MTETHASLDHLLGVRAGFTHSLIAISALQMSISGPGGAYLPPPHHTRKRAAEEARLADLERAKAAIDAKLGDIRDAIADHPDLNR